MSAEKQKYGVHSEAGKLRKVMVCAPGLAHKRLTPSNCDELLFDDVIWVDQAKRDHFDFVTKMRERGVDVLEMHNLLTDIVQQPEALKWILDRKITDDTVGVGLNNEVRSWLEGQEPRHLAEFLIGGVAGQDLPQSAGADVVKMYNDYLGHSSFILPPLPNTQFTRDTTCWIYGGVTLNPMYWPARRQETLLTTAIYKFHKEFTNADFQVWYGDPDKDHGQSTLEGGDVMPIGKGIVLIGMGERTSRQAIGQLARNLFAKGAVKSHRRRPAEVACRHAPGHRVQLLRPRPGHGLPGSGEGDRAVHHPPGRKQALRHGRAAHRQVVHRGGGRATGRQAAGGRDRRQQLRRRARTVG